jgi:hypothetical protein
VEEDVRGVKGRIRALWRESDGVDIVLTVAGVITLLVAALPLGGLSTAASVLVGAIITFLVARYYYRRAGEELRAESAELRHYINVLLDCLQDAGHITFERDPSGRPVRVRVLRLRGGGIDSHSVGGGTITTTQPEEPEGSGPPQRGEEGGA